jgi:hypothetical protein
MDMFNIQYPEWAKEYKMPYEYNQEEIDIFLNTIHNHYVCNGCILKDNIGFFYTEFARNKFNVKECLKHSYSELPWQLILRNPLLVEEKNFNKILRLLKKKETHSQYFYAISKYQEISKEQALEMFKCLPKGELFDFHKIFVSKNVFLLRENVELATMFKDKISNNKYSQFYFTSYPLEYQVEYIKNCKYSYYEKLELIKKMDINKNEKIKLVVEITEKEL